MARTRGKAADVHSSRAGGCSMKPPINGNSVTWNDPAPGGNSHAHIEMLPLANHQIHMKSQPEDVVSRAAEDASLSDPCDPDITVNPRFSQIDPSESTWSLPPCYPSMGGLYNVKNETAVSNTVFIL
jgi:hypothetical protein